MAFLRGAIWGWLLWCFTWAAFPLQANSDSTYEDLKYPEQILGADEWVFHLIVDGDNRAVLSRDKSPLYLGIKHAVVKSGPDKGKTKTYRVTVSQKSIEAKGHLLRPIAPAPQASSDWVDSAFHLKLSPKAWEGLLKHFEEAPTELLDYFSGMTPTKSEMIRKLLYDQKVILTGPELQSLRRSWEDPNPAPIIVRIPIEVPLKESLIGATVSQVLFEMVSDIELKTLTFDLEQKKIEFDPKLQTIHFHLEAAGAELTGPMHDTGHVNKLYKYGVHIRDYDEWSDLISGKVGPLTLDVWIRFAKDPESGLWRIQLFNPTKGQRAVQMKMREQKPRVKLVFRPRPSDKKGPNPDEETKNPPLTESSVRVIEDVLSDTLENAFNTYFFPEDLGFSIPIKSSDPLKHSGDVQLQNRLALVRLFPDGLDIAFDGRGVIHKAASCMTNWKQHQVDTLRIAPNAFSGDVHPLAAGAPSDSEGKPWVLQSLYPEKPSWTAAGSDPSLLTISTDQESLKLVMHSAWSSGAFCFASGAWWPRPPYIPNVELNATRPPEMKFGDHEMELSIQTEYLPYKPTNIEKDEVYRLDYDRRQSLPLSTKFKISDARRSFQWSGLQFTEFSASENEFVNRVLHDVLFADLKKTNQQEWETSFENLEESVLHRHMKIWGLHLTEEGLSAHLDPKKFSIITALLGNGEKIETPSGKLSSRANEMRMATLLDSKVLYNSSFSRVRVQWHSFDGNQSLLYKWRVRTIAKSQKEDLEDGTEDGYTWTTWSDLTTEDFADFPLKGKGQYLFQVKAMTPDFRFEETPASLPFYFDEPAPEPKKENTNNQWSSPKPVAAAASSEPVPEKKRMGAKALFGCNLQPKEATPSSLWLMALALMGLFFLRIRTKNL